MGRVPHVVDYQQTGSILKLFGQREAGADHVGRMVTVGQLIYSPTDTGDARLLDITDQLAVRLARDGDPEPIHLEKTDTRFAIEWKGHYRIDRDAARVRDQRRQESRATPPRRSLKRADLKISNMVG
jgi:hypothetical protein